MTQPTLPGVQLVGCLDTTIAFEDATFKITCSGNAIRVALDDSENCVTITQRSQTFKTESSIAGKFVLDEETQGEIDYSRHFSIHWEEHLCPPQLMFAVSPRAIVRRYQAGQHIELGLEDIPEYRVVYRDGVEATFRRTGSAAFDFSFSTGLYGAFWKDPDGSYTLKFKGERLEATEEPQHSQSKFIVSRSKYSGNLLLILQDDAAVYLR